MGVRTTLARSLAVLLAAAVLSPAAGAEAATPSCSGATCNGKSPVGKSCAKDAKTIWSDTLYLGEGSSEDIIVYKQELRYSASCRASWTRATGKVKRLPEHTDEVWTVKIGIWTRIDPSLPVVTVPKGWTAERDISTSKNATFQFSSPMASDTSVDQVNSYGQGYALDNWSGWVHL
ncbi:MAG: DUF2690 domain-containing protein [Kineosporiaceae bacterium]